MNYSKKDEYAMITVYGDSAESDISRIFMRAFAERDLKILSPKDEDGLQEAAQNSVLIIIAVSGDDDPRIHLAKSLLENRMIVADILAFCAPGYDPNPLVLLGKGFDGVLKAADCPSPDFQRFIISKIARGNRRLAGLIQEEEYRRICDALSCAPASMIVFDADKRAVFVSDHYFRAYPRIAPKLIRGLSVYDAYDLMMREEGLHEDDPRFSKLQKFWHNLEGSIEFTLDDGTSYRLKAVRLPSRRGTVVMGQNISDFFSRKIQIEQAHKTRFQEILAISHAVEKALEELEAQGTPLNSLEKINKIRGLIAQIQADT